MLYFSDNLIIIIIIIKPEQVDVIIHLSGVGDDSSIIFAYMNIAKNLQIWEKKMSLEKSNKYPNSSNQSLCSFLKDIFKSVYQIL